ncbi:MAG: hypothetical protein HYY23_20945 [Verrucomicrobia bacterium]|nr:hypothetical protein [Verrucomicrobiota bacterium]
MKARLTLITVLAVALVQVATAQTKQPGNPEDNGLLPKTETFYINVPPDSLNNGKLESLGVAIANNGNVIVGWEDDGADALTDLEAVWVLLDPAGKGLNVDAEIKAADGSKGTSKYRAFFRKDGSPVPGYTSWGPKIKANLFGDGIGMGATAFDLHLEVPEFAAFNGTGDFPAVQLLSNDGKPSAIVSGASDAYAATDGDIRIADWEYLSNGNIVIIGESRQKQDLIDKYKGASAENHATYRIVDATGKEVRPVGLVSSEPVKSEIWHGVGVTKNGFAVRFSWNGVGAVRLFDNSGAPITTNLDVAKITGKVGAANGGRGDSLGFHGNGVDAYVVVNSGTDEQGAKQVWLTVLNSTNGSVRWSRAVADDLTLNGPDRLDAAIDPSGRVIAVFDDTSASGGANRLVLGRMFDETGKPVGGTFFVSEKEVAGAATQDSRDARAAWRGGLAAVVWESKNNPESPDMAVVGVRLFSTFTAGSVESVGLKRIVADTPIINPQADALGNWEPYISVLGNSTFLIEGNTFADGSASEQRYVVALQPVDGKPMKLAEGFFGDDGKPYKGQVNASRQNGNPGRVAGDKRPGAVNFIVGAEASPHVYPAFASDNRWNLGFDRGADGRYGTIQTFKLDPATLTQTSLSKAIDAVNGRLTSGTPAVTPEIGRFGGDVAGLDNGNFVAVVDDRSNARATDRAATAVIVAPDGTIVKDSFTIENGQIWSNVAAYQGGFCVRINGNLRFYDNAGNLKGTAAQSTSGETFDGGRGDGTRIASHINSPYVFLAGKVTSGNLVKVAAFDSRDQKFVAVTEVSEPAFAGDFDRVNIAVDALNRMTVSWVSKPPGYEQQQVAARVLAFDGAKKAFTPLTKSFLAFLNASKVGGIRTLQMSVATTTKEICIAAKGEINLQNKPELGVTSPREVNLFTVISHPDPKDDPTAPAGGGAPVGQTQLYAAPAGGWTYTIDGTKATGGAANSGFTSLDGTWSHDNGSDEWDGSPVGGTFGATNRPGGVSSIDGYLRLEDTGDPRDFAFADPSSNRKVYLGHDITKEGATATVLDTGVTLHFRARIPTDGTLDQLHPDGNPGGAGPKAYPSTGDGYLIHDGGKGNFGIKQAAGGVVSFSLATATDTGSKSGLVMNNLNGTTISGSVDSGEAGTANIHPLDPTQWHEFWIAVGKDSTGKGTHKVDIYLDGSSTPTTYFVTAGDGSDFSGISYIAMGLGSTGQSGALDVDYFDYKLGTVAPTGGTGGGKPAFSPAKLAGTTLTISWTGSGKLQEASDVTGPWTDVTGNPQGTFSAQTTGPRKFYRVLAP